MSRPRDPDFILFNLSPQDFSWRGMRLLLALFFGSLGFAALISPWVYWAFAAWAQGHPGGWADYVVDKGLDKTFDRLRWLPVLIFLPVLIRCCGLWSRQALGLSLERSPMSAALPWAALGMIMFLPIAGLQYFFFDLSLKETDATGSVFHPVFTLILTALLSGIILGLLEEIVMRGLVLRIFYTAIKPIPALVGSALFFAWTHFKDIPDALWNDQMPVTATSGLTLFWGTLISASESLEWVRFLNLFLVGLILNLLFLRTHSLWPCIGLHAGWVASMAWYRKIFEMPDQYADSLWGSESMLDGLLATPLLLTLVVALKSLKDSGISTK